MKILLSLVPVALSFLYTLWAVWLEQAGRLPNPLATHWGISGVPDGFAGFDEHLFFALLSFLLLGIIWIALVWYPKIPDLIRFILLGVTAVPFAILVIIQVAALAVQIDAIDATTARFEIPFLVIFVPLAAVLVIFLAKPKLDFADQLRLTVRGIPVLRLEFSDISSANKVEANWRDFGGLGLRVAKGKVAFLPSSGSAVEITTVRGETILVRSDDAEDLVRQINQRRGK